MKIFKNNKRKESLEKLQKMIKSVDISVDFQKYSSANSYIRIIERKVKDIKKDKILLILFVFFLLFDVFSFMLCLPKHDWRMWLNLFSTCIMLYPVWSTYTRIESDIIVADTYIEMAYDGIETPAEKCRRVRNNKMKNIFKDGLQRVEN